MLPWGKELLHHQVALFTAKGRLLLRDPPVDPLVEILSDGWLVQRNWP